MKAVQIRAPRTAPEVVSVPQPQPGPGQVLIRVTAAGLCHSDFMLLDMAKSLVQRRFCLPLTLGHEGVGTVAVLGEGVTGLRVGEPVAVYGPWGCGLCRMCASGRENYCTRAVKLGIRPPGLGSPGAMAQYMLVASARHLVPVGDLDPAQVAPLTDAGLTAYHAMARSLPKLTEGSVAVVIGVGGLGHLAIQMLRASTPARVIALDVSESKLQLATEVGAQETVCSDERTAKRAWPWAVT
jgi:propanol-preferring alcohol dehydrogenase